MRGFVTSVSRSETMANGEPRRHVTIMGHDFGKLLQIIRIYYLNGSVVGDNILSGNRCPGTNGRTNVVMLSHSRLISLYQSAGVESGTLLKRKSVHG
jgi:hypothetical protein